MVPRPIRLNLILLCLGASLAAAAEAPYTENFNSYSNGSVPTNFVETPDSNWTVYDGKDVGTSGYYYGGVAVSGGQATVATGLPLTNVSGQNFTVKTSFAASTNGGIDFRLAKLGLVVLGTNPNLTEGGYYLNYYVSGLYDVFGKLFLGGAVSSSSLDYHGSWQNPPFANPHFTISLHGAYIDGILFLTGTVSNGVQTIFVLTSDKNPLTGPYFGFRQWVATSSFHVAGLNVWYDDFSVTFETRPVKFGNIATRLNVGTGDEVAIVGFIVTGNAPKRVLLRGTGSYPPPSLSDPILELYGSGGLLAINDNWQDTQQAEIEATGLAPIDSNASVLIALLRPGTYTAVLRGKNQTTGSGLLEVYDLAATTDSKLGNISTRGSVGTGDKVMIAGVIVTGDSKARVVVRALGPSLAAKGINGFLADPTLELHDQNGSLVQTSDNWRDSQQTEIIATSLAPSNDAEAAILADLLPTNYTAIVRGKNDTTGVALVEVYHLN